MPKKASVYKREGLVSRKREHRNYARQRPDTELQGAYGSSRWKKLRKLVKQRDRGLCVICRQQGRITPMSEVDHIKPARTYPDLFFDIENLRSLCHSCHTRYGVRDKLT